jgi:MaoC like domain
MFHTIIAHGMWGASLLSALMGTRLPGPGAIHLEQRLWFRQPVMIGDTITVSVTAANRDPERKRVTFDCRRVNQRAEVVNDGTAKVTAPTEKIRRLRVTLPGLRLGLCPIMSLRLVTSGSSWNSSSTLTAWSSSRPTPTSISIPCSG